MRAAGDDGRVRVAHILGSLDVGGTELNAIRVLERLDRQRFDVRIVCMSADGPLLPRVEALGIPMVRFRVRGFVRPGTYWQLLRFGRWLRRERIQVVHAHDIYSNIFAASVAALAGTPLVIASRRWWTNTPRRFLRPLNRLAYRLADLVLANAPSVARLVAGEGVDPSRIVVVPNFVEPEAFTAPDAGGLAALQATLGLRDQRPVVGAVANLRPIKGHADLLRAFAQVRAAFPSAVLVIVGEGSERLALEQLARELGLADGVRMPGSLPSRPSPHWAFDVSVLASHGEGFPNAVLEAMACGRPVVATRVGGVLDVIRDGETGMLVDSGDVDGLFRGIVEMLRDADLRRRYGEAGRRVSSQEYSSAAVMQLLEGIYLQGVE